MEAGNRCFDERVPEEVNRRIVDHVSDVHLPYTEHARRNLLHEGIRADVIVKTGSPMPEVLAHYAQKIAASNVLGRLELSSREYLLASAHREENIDDDDNFAALLASLSAVARKFRKRVIVSTHPRTRRALAARKRGGLPAKVEFLKPLAFTDYIKLQQNAYCVLSDSGTLTEEASILAFPAVMLRQAHERPEGMDEGAVIMSGLTPARVVEAIEVSVAHYDGQERPFAAPADYSADNVSRKVVRTILSYTDYVNRTVWFK
jgi:UDP-N-acetylglucosamine 2-epimerase (non-hydrolysing)